MRQRLDDWRQFTRYPRSLKAAVEGDGREFSAQF